MKKGDTVPVTIAGQTIAQAVVREVGDGEVTLVVPATLVRMATRTEIAQEVPAPVEQESVIVGVDTPSVDAETPSVETQADGGTPVVEMPEPTPPSEPSETAPVAETAEPVEQTNPVTNNE